MTSLEIRGYAKYLGMNLEEDENLLWIARSGLKTPLPEHWRACRTGNQEIYYFNFKTGESIWAHPCDQYYKDLYQKEKAKKLQSNEHKDQLQNELKVSLFTLNL